jgi:hypothetical protein
VSAAFVFAARVPLKPNEARLLLFMAHTALDTDKPPRYFASREASALALGRMVPDAPDLLDPDSARIEAERAAAFQRVKIATQGLVSLGAISRIRRGREGSRAEFAITLGTQNVPPVKYAIRTPQRLAKRTSRGTQSVPPRNKRSQQGTRHRNNSTTQPRPTCTCG